MIDINKIEQNARGAGSNQSGSAFVTPKEVIEMVTEIRRLGAAMDECQDCCGACSKDCIKKHREG